MKALILLTALLAIFPFASAKADKDRGGGDLCEQRIQDIRDDIVSWIQRDGHKGLSLGQWTPEDYSRSMNASTKVAKIRCVSPGDKGYPVEINGTPKECRFDKRGSSATVTCDKSKFESRSESDQYRLIHHEYAGIAQLEKADEDVSSYWISNQISGYLVDVKIKRLAVRSAKPGSSNIKIDGFQSWEKINDDSHLHDSDLFESIVEAFRSAQWTDCSFILAYEQHGDLSFPWAKFQRLNWSPKGEPTTNWYSLTLPLYLSSDIQPNPRAGVFRNRTNPNVLRQFMEYKRTTGPNGEEILMALDLIMEFDHSQKRLIRVQPISEEIQKYNVGTVTAPVWRERLITIGSLTCHAK